MGEVFNALASLNTSLRLGLTGEQLLRAEGSFKSAMAARVNFPKELAGSPEKLAEGWEIMTYLKPREKPMTMDQLQTLAKQAVAGTATKG